MPRPARRRLAPLVLVAVLTPLAGCAAPGSGPAPDADAQDGTGGALVVPWDLVECAFVAFGVAVDPDRLAPYMPEGFTASTGNRVPLPVPVDAARSAFLGLEAFECRSGRGLEGPVDALDYGSFFTFATPPEALANGSIEQYYVKWDTLVPDEPRRDALAARGLPARAGEATVTLEETAQGVRLGATLALKGVGGFTITGAGARRGASSGFEFVEYMPAEDGTLAAWHGHAQDRDAVAAGAGTLQVEPGTWIADVMGGTTASVTWTAGTWTFLHGNVTHPVRAIGDVR